MQSFIKKKLLTLYVELKFTALVCQIRKVFLIPEEKILLLDHH
jgi:hypothetical protein